MAGNLLVISCRPVTCKVVKYIDLSEYNSQHVLGFLIPQKVVSILNNIHI
jgi:hypothetical protein